MLCREPWHAHPARLETLSSHAPPGSLPLHRVTGDVVLVVDLGGGTVDFTVHELVAGGAADGADHFKEVCCRRAELAGSTFLDDRFEAYLAERLGLGESGYAAWKDEKPRHWLSLMHAWEDQKRTFGEGDELRCSAAWPLTCLEPVRIAPCRRLWHYLTRCCLRTPPACVCVRGCLCTTPLIAAGPPSPSMPPGPARSSCPAPCGFGCART